MAFLNKLFKKFDAFKKSEKPKAKKTAEAEIKPAEKAAEISAEKPETKTAAPEAKKIDSKIILSSHLAEKAIAGQKFNQYVFKVIPGTNKIAVAREVKKIYGVKVSGVNMVNIPRKVRRVGKNLGFKSGYKKAIITLAEGQTIEMK